MSETLNQQLKEKLYAQISKYHSQGLSDRQIAKRVGKTPYFIRTWRREHNKQPNGKCRCKISKTEHDKRMNCWEKGLTDTESTKILKISYQAYYHWRQKQNLPLNYSLSQPFKTILEHASIEDDDYLLELLEKTINAVR
jgi:transposase